MSIHGKQFLLPLFMKEGTQVPFLQDDDELTLAFYLLLKDLNKNHKVLSFSRLLWPLLSIPGTISTHIFLDGVKIFSKKGKFTNPPRQPLIGHILRNVDNLSKTGQLERIKNVLSYEDQEAEELGKGEESEYQAFEIPSLINPRFLNTLDILIPQLQYSPIEDYMPLDSPLSTEEALNISEKYRNIIETLKGNAHRWETQIELIGDKVDKWLNELNVDFKDIESRYQSKIKKTSSTIDNQQINEKINLEQDKIEQWKINEKKRLIDNLANQFSTLDRHLEDILKKNKFYSNSDILKRKSFEDLIPSIDRHFSFLDENLTHISSDIIDLQEKFEEIKQEVAKIDNEAEIKLDQTKTTLDEKLLTRDQRISEYQSEQQYKIEEINERRDRIEILFQEVKRIIYQKKQDCLNEVEELKKWSLNDNDKKFFAKPIRWIYMPFYAMFVEDNEIMEEYMKIILPGYVLNDKNRLYNEATEALGSLRDLINEKIEDNMRIRSNFEFTVENKNLINDPTVKKKLQKGLSLLRTKNVIDEEIDQKIRWMIENYIRD